MYVYELCLLKYVHTYVPTHVRIANIDSLYVLILHAGYVPNTTNTYIIVSFSNNQFSLVFCNFSQDLCFTRTINFIATYKLDRKTIFSNGVN